MRTFITIEIPEQIKTALASLQNHLRQAKADINWTKPENLHLTLIFLGEIEESRLAEIARACSDAATGVRSFTLRLSGSGVFPNVRQPRVLWAGLVGEIEMVARMRAALEESLEQLGFEREEKAFRPHLTIGRIKSNRKTSELVALADYYQLPDLSFDVREIVLMRSELHPAGARYTALARIELKE